MKTLRLILCWLLGDQWELYKFYGLQPDGKYFFVFQCQRCKYYTKVHNRDGDCAPPKPFHIFRRFRAWLNDKAGIRWSSQNLNEKAGVVVGSMWRHGRGWLWLGSNCIGLEWSFLAASSSGISIDLGGEDEFSLSIRVNRLFGLYLSLSQLLPRRWTRNWKWWDWSWGREFGISIHDGSIWFSIFNDTTGWSSQNSWQEFNFHYVDFLFGRMQSLTRLLDTGEITIAFPEGNYQVKYKKELRRWWRPRWPFGKKTVIKFALDIDDKPIPVPGKGENSWDIDDDAIYSMYVCASTLHGAIGELTQSVYRSRLNYGGINWKPDENLANESITAIGS